MMLYLLKFLLCSLLLYAFYHLLLRNETSFRFNRYYLLAILILAAVIPVTVTNTVVVPVMSQLRVPDTFTEGPIGLTPTQVGENTGQKLLLWQLFLMLYTPVCFFLLFRFFRNLATVSRLGGGAKKVKYKGLKLILRQDITETFSFMGAIFANERQYEAGMLPDAILEHERAHVEQRHSYDLVIFEFIACFLWFNPAVYLIRRAIRLNHEFLADQHAIQHLGNTNHYQNLLIQFASQQHLLKLPLVSHLTFGETKKRIIIMAKQSSKGLRVLKKSVAFLFVAALFLWLGNEKVIAQQSGVEQSQTQQENSNEQVAQDRPPPPPPVMVMLNPEAKVRFTDAQGKQVTSLFKSLTSEQKSYFFAQGEKAEIQLPPPPRAHLTAAMMEDFKDAKKYGLWIDGKRQDNESLNNYKPEDFHHFFKTRVSKSAKNYGKYQYHLDMTTMKNLKVYEDKVWLTFKQEFIPKPEKPKSH